MKKFASQWTRYASTDEQEEAISTIEKWLKKLNKQIVGATTIGKSPQTVILDLKYQGSEIYVNSSGFLDTERGYPGVKVFNKKVSEGDFETFKSILQENGMLETSPVVSRIVDSILKEAVNISELSSGFLRLPKAIEKAHNIMMGIEPLEVGSKTYKAKGLIKGNQLKKGMVVLASYNQYNQGAQLYEIMGVTGDDKQYGEGGIKYDSVKAAMKDIGASTLKEMEAIQDKNEYGNHSYLYVKDLASGDSGPWFYLFEGRWCRGSGAEKLTFVLMDEIATPTKAVASLKQAQSQLVEFYEVRGPAYPLLIKIFSEVINNEMYYSVYFSSKTSGSLLLKRFVQGKVVPDLKAGKEATNFAKKLKTLLES